ncbi:lantibiotic dehydratase [Streptomyces mirabilis]|uniref:lantibiotic dehydratase n=1 Tax=Streptomyces mirabilis TaxID=68239 RepID=UPI0037190767
MGVLLFDAGHHCAGPGDRLTTAVRPQLVEIATGARPELLAPTAINFLWNNYTPPMARFLCETGRATAPQVTWFDRGAAWTLPFTPALTYRRTVLTVARWKVRSRALPARTATLQEWADQLHAWRARLRVPERVLLGEDDQQLPLDRTKDVHLDPLRMALLGIERGDHGSGARGRRPTRWPPAVAVRCRHPRPRRHRTGAAAAGRQGGAWQSPGGGTATHMSDRTQHHGTPRSATHGEGPVFEIGF